MKNTEPTAVQDPRELAEQLATARALEAARCEDELKRRTAAADHQRALADVDVEVRQAELDRVDRAETAEADADLARLYRKASGDGQRTRLASLMARSGEARALLLDKTRRGNLKLLVPALVAFGAWSTAGVQAGGAAVMQLDRGDATWWALWGLEPALILVVARLIVVRSRLAQAGGELSREAERIGIGCLVLSFVLNICAAAWPTVWDAAGVGVLAATALTHCLGPAGAAVVAHLIGALDRDIAAADPWTEKQGEKRVKVPLLADLLPELARSSASRTASQSAPEGAHQSAPEGAPEAVWPVPVEGRTVLPIVARPQQADEVREEADNAPGEPRSFVADLAEQRRSAAAVVHRPNRGVKVPVSARKSTKSARSSSDDELRRRLADLIESGALPVDASVRQVQKALRLSHDRAKRIMTSPPEAPMAVAS
ncbi:hypothetical protein ABGB12_34865 [Actinocorallia sp. B10E7]|uniref:hypothetical protein n=1 Tax=Actinocorallia sp. B10E7 TaxID=3153558 RepID=UPI00325E975C